MAEFRKLFYALGFAAMLAGVSPVASAKVSCGITPAPIIGNDSSFADLVGEFILDCAGGEASSAPVVVTIKVRDGQSLVSGMSVSQLTFVVVPLDPPKAARRLTLTPALASFQYCHAIASLTYRSPQPAEVQQGLSQLAGHRSFTGSVPQPLVAMGSPAQGFHGAPVVLRW